MDEKELPSSSDESDEDFVPKDEENYSDTGSEGSDYETPDDEDDNFKSHKRKRKTKTCKKKAKVNDPEEIVNNEAPESKKEIDVDALWADFKKDVDNSETKKTAENCKTASEKTNESSQCSAEKNNSTDSKKKNDFSFPSKAKARVGGGGGGLSKVLNQISKKEKMSTLQKSRLDWNKFKKNEGLEEEIKIYNKGKDGYLEKQDFLQRTDLRQFEIEKELRSARRKF